MIYKGKELSEADAEIRARILIAFLSLGPDADEIGYTLRRYRYYGIKRDTQQSPLLPFLRWHGIAAEVISLGNGNPAVGIILSDRKNVWFAVKYCPEIIPVREFILAFDRGMFPALEKKL